MVLLRFLVTAASAMFLAVPTEALEGTSELQSILKNTHRSSEYKYPTDFTRGILPVEFPLTENVLVVEPPVKNR
jgi:hypothetical protein